MKLETPQFDARFPNQNQTKACWQYFVDYQKCIKSKGADYEPCTQFYKAYRALCPDEWTAKWQERLDAGKFAADI